MSVLDFTITSARSPADIEDLRKLFHVYASGLGVDLCFQDFATEVATLPGKYAPPEGELLIVRDNTGNAVGCVALCPLSEGCCAMKRLYVIPTVRGTGLGRMLAQAIITAAIRIGYRNMLLDSLPTMTQAISLYKQLGFKETAPYYKTPVEGIVFLGKSLAS